VLSARNRLEGKIIRVEKDKLAAVVKLRIEVPSEITAFITREAADEMDLKEGDKAAVVIKKFNDGILLQRLRSLGC